MQNSNSPDGLKVVLEQCAEKTGLDANVLKQCMGSTVGNQAQHAYADKTEKLLPQVEYVPWIVLDGAHSDRIQYKASTDLVQLVCDAYKVINFDSILLYNDYLKFIKCFSLGSKS